MIRHSAATPRQDAGWLCYVWFARSPPIRGGWLGISGLAGGSAVSGQELRTLDEPPRQWLLSPPRGGDSAGGPRPRRAPAPRGRQLLHARWRRHDGVGPLRRNDEP